ncbi:hypothetical protein PC121_g10808 [Phytophthora cactorum]|nr:hypothetical protein PC121_g10808 [Phytophthora cactorum]KAG4055685.1 hypothetical protein PC123_g9206 [Phytophthora cactorum]
MTPTLPPLRWLCRSAGHSVSVERICLQSHALSWHMKRRDRYRPPRLALRMCPDCWHAGRHPSAITQCRLASAHHQERVVRGHLSH